MKHWEDLLTFDLVGKLADTTCVVTKVGDHSLFSIAGVGEGATPLPVLLLLYPLSLPYNAEC